MGATAKLAAVAVLFAIALAILMAAAVTHSVVPVFLAWIPLLAAPWVLVRRETDPGAREPLQDEAAEDAPKGPPEEA